MRNMSSDKSRLARFGSMISTLVSGALFAAMIANGSGVLAQSTATAQASSSSSDQSSPSQVDATQKAGSPATTLSVQVNVVNVLATVRDKHGKIVPNLTQSDFVLIEDGRPQNIRYFTKESDLPLTLGLLVDTSLSQRR